MEDLYIFLIAIVVLFIMWLYIGGPNREESTSGKFIEPSAPLDSGQVYDEKVFDGNTWRDRAQEVLRSN